MNGLLAGNSPAALSLVNMIRSTPGCIWFPRLSETSGTTSVDDRGTANGTYTGGYTLNQTGLIANSSEKAVLLNGSTGFIDYGDPAALRLTQFSLEAWINTASSAGYPMIIAKASASSSIRNYEMDVDDVTGKVRFYITSGDGNYIGFMGNTVVVGGTHHVVVSKDAAAMRIYVDGALDATLATAAAPDTTSGNLVVGRLGSNSSSYFSGRVSLPNITNRALHPSEILARYQKAAGIN